MSSKNHKEVKLLKVLLEIITKVYPFISPMVLLEGTPYKPIWLQNETRRRKNRYLVGLGLAVPVFVLHYLLLEYRIEAKPPWFWFSFRIGFAGIFLVVLATFKYTRFFITSTFFAMYALTLFQAMGCNYDVNAPIFFVPLIPVIFIMLDGSFTVIPSIMITSLFSISASQVLYDRFERIPNDESVFWSVFVVGLFFVLQNSPGKKAAISTFLAREEKSKLDAEKVRLEQSMHGTLRGFTSREQYARLTEAMKTMSVDLAVDSILRIFPRPVFGFYSDIRDFTGHFKENSLRDNRPLLEHSKKLLTIFSNNRGHPRVVGDLVFSYHDLDDQEKSFLLTLKGVSESWKFIDNFNRLNESKINRGLIISFGESLVGNVGGHQFSREISAFGSSINLLSRIDSVVKNLPSDLHKGHVVFSKDVVPWFEKYKIGPIKIISLKDYDVVIRNYEELEDLFAVDVKEIEGFLETIEI